MTRHHAHPKHWVHRSITPTQICLKGSDLSRIRSRSSRGSSSLLMRAFVGSKPLPPALPTPPSCCSNTLSLETVLTAHVHCYNEDAPYSFLSHLHLITLPFISVLLLGLLFLLIAACFLLIPICVLTIHLRSASLLFDCRLLIFPCTFPFRY